MKSATAGEDDNQDELRADTFELNYVVNWLTALISRSEAEENILSEASALLALCADMGSYATVKLRDVPLDNQDYGSVGAQTWGGACVLSEMVCEDPERFGLVRSSMPTSSNSHPFRILELGAGTGLVALVVTRLMSQLSSTSSVESKVEVVATDYYPSVLENLVSNIASSNIDSEGGGRVGCTAHRLDWSSFPSIPNPDPPLDRPFDVVFGADIIYEAEHAMWIRDCLCRLLGKLAFFHLLIPLRRTHTAESKTIEAVFPFARSAKGRDVEDGTDSEGERGEGKGEEALKIHEKELIECETDSGEEVIYAYYRIGWWLERPD
ncbi:hypothetical protein EST38_g2849 [Candolleomyces aberdarensis]|uniref:Uncharacterized protein n=1 Tax=Candolleomyces aberdarensis TaxID=2316362 RepID=A0A4Q2DRZ3_9AGAR|nr:hypothetical protein EST38_g2849 [Candolleomyces aberdarensis]